jgi:hypothetical protein
MFGSFGQAFSEKIFRNRPIRKFSSSRSANKHGRRRQFLFLIGRFKKFFSSEAAWPNEQTLVGSIYGRSSFAL